MGTLVDTTVLISAERASMRRRIPADEVIERMLGDNLGRDEEVGVAAITASELLYGLHRADAKHRQRREALVEYFLNAFPIVPFDLLCARAHASLWARLAAAGADIGAHDRLVAATAIAIGWRVATSNQREFERVPGLSVVAVSA